jgi:phosphoglycolate phosphatase-like HAD superfamily hydrolase
MAFYSNYRVRRLGLDGVLDSVFSPADHDLPSGISPEQIRKYPGETYNFRFTTHKHTPSGRLKPDAGVLRTIISEIGAQINECAYVGDSLMKDIAMAQEVGVLDMWAKYGLAQDRDAYKLLREVTHWTDEAVEREKKISTGHVVPTITLSNQFSELLSFFVE